MKPETVGRNYNKGKCAPIECIKNDTLEDLEIRDSCFLLLIIHEGSAIFKVGDASFKAIGPCFVCFDEALSPLLVQKHSLKCDSVYFCPTFLNVNMTFSKIRSGNFEQLASVHDLFLLKPFTDKSRYSFPILDEHRDTVKRLFDNLAHELDSQSDWYWSCRSRSYFIEMMLLLERTYVFFGHNSKVNNTADRIINPHLKKAVVYIENNYRDSITLESIAKSASLNHSTLTQLFKSELCMTPIEYLWHHRLTVAKKFLEFTELPIKEISSRCGFRTAQHFTRKFEKTTGTNPSVFRQEAVAKRKSAF